MWKTYQIHIEVFCALWYTYGYERIYYGFRKEKQAMIFDLQKASMWKRISAALCDLIALLIVVVGFSLLLSAVFGYDGHAARLEEISEKYETDNNKSRQQCTDTC